MSFPLLCYYLLSLILQYPGFLPSSGFLFWGSTKRHIPQILRQVLCTRRHFKGSFLCDAKHHQKPRYNNNKTLGQNKLNLEFPYAVKILNVSIFGGACRRAKLPLNLPKFD